MTAAASVDKAREADELARMVAESDTGGRSPADLPSRMLLMLVPLA